LTHNELDCGKQTTRESIGSLVKTLTSELQNWGKTELWN